jgi:hypothetical protein
MSAAKITMSGTNNPASENMNFPNDGFYELDDRCGALPFGRSSAEVDVS